ncbi:fatty acyl-AMP ligase [Streptomyces guryensis]|uniref:Fatty acyl-AMP ligase n=1 Tax=Streptomyces guryensis TaxID=2886947 RepID=A0A9Q3VMF9_9ACTN|nr:fatty acyl-AMP ligase [Streptomyces guryensis]MCD9876573.1 fatty acyl-AMP ligase [Streptomyces guryensis]
MSTTDDGMAVRIGSVSERSPLTLPALLAHRAKTASDQVAYVHLINGEEPGEQTTYGELHAAVQGRAQALAGRPGAARSAVLMYPTGLEFIRSFLACAAAGIAGAPVQVPTRRLAVQQLRGIADDAGTTMVLTTRSVRDQVYSDFGELPQLAGLDLIATDDLAPPATLVRLPEVGLSDVALLQYTSGATGSPKGVMVTHANYWANTAETDALWPFGDDGTVVTWLPLFHDMGVMLGVVVPLWAGCPAYLMEPEAFIRRPARWLEALSRFGGTHSSAPNFAYDLCLRDGPREPIDLSRWRAAISGAEPVRPHTMHEFIGKFAPYGLNPRAVSPAYGLAENTLKACGSRADTEPAQLWLDADELGQGRVVLLPGDPAGGSELTSAGVPVMSCGVPVGETQIRIVDPHTLRAVGPDRLGEIWVSGPCVAAGYIGRGEESERSFRARIRDEEEAGPFLRTGDTGFVRDGEVYVTGRMKDMIIIKGRDRYPQDLEYSAEQSHPLLHPTSAAAFVVDTGEQESLVLVVEVDGKAQRSAGIDELSEAVRGAVARDHRLEAADVVLIRRGALPRTTSGKIRRNTCRELYESGTLPRLDRALERA